MKNLNLRQCVEHLSPNLGADMARYGHTKKDIISLAQGEGDTSTSEFIIAGAQKAMEAGKTFYAPVLGHEELRQEISDYYSRIYSRSVPTERIFVTSSGTTAMHFALTALLEKDDEVVAVTPIWKNLLGAVELAQACIHDVPLNDIDGKWHLDLEALFDSCSPKTKVILITTPSNPTGWIMSDEEIKAVLEFARARNIWIISDEVYGRLTYDMARAPSFLDFAKPDDKLFTVNSFSKSWAMTGWRLGWLVGPSKAENAIREIALYDNMGSPSFTQFGAIEALRCGEDFIKDQMKKWQKNRAMLYDCFSGNRKIIGQKPPSTFYSFFRVKDKPDCLEFARQLIDDVSLSLAPGCAFGKVGKGYIRLCFAVSQARLEDALNRLERGIKE